MPHFTLDTFDTMKCILAGLLLLAQPLSWAFLSPLSPRSTTLFSSFSNAELETAFYAVDVKARGSIPRSSFGEALHDLGIDLSQVQIDLLFEKYDADKGGSIDIDEFKELMTDDVLAGLSVSEILVYLPAVKKHHC
jgi:hypothetical protein